MNDKEKLENTEVEPIEDDELDEVTGGGRLNPPRVDIHAYEIMLRAECDFCSFTSYKN